MMITIAYEQHVMFLLPADRREAGRGDTGCVATDDGHLDEAFAVLVGGKDVVVRMYHGIRHLHTYLLQHYRYVKAAGGVVTTPAGEYLMIDRQGHWDLPKGMVEPLPVGGIRQQETLAAAEVRWKETPSASDARRKETLAAAEIRRKETLAAAAAREVMEETGVTPESVNQLIAKTYHIYDKYGGWHLKQTSWFAMTAQHQPTRPQREEEIAQAAWVPRDVCLDRLAHSYATLRQVGKRLATLRPDNSL